jgi:hypothetical protein
MHPLKSVIPHFTIDPGTMKHNLAASEGTLQRQDIIQSCGRKANVE